MSVNSGDLERFWPRFTFMEDSDLTRGENGSCGDSHRLCKNLASLSQMSLTSPCPPACLYGSNSNGLHHHHEQADILSLLPQNNNTTKPGPQSPRPLSTSETQNTVIPVKRPNNTSAVTPSIRVPNPPTLSDESIFKIPICPPSKKTNGIRKSSCLKEATSESEQESITIPPMRLLDLAPIKNNGHNETIVVTSLSPPKQSPVAPAPTPIRGCDHNHHFNGNGIPKLNGSGSIGSGGSSSGSSHRTLTPPTSPSLVTISPEIPTKSPSKSKSRKIAKFFRTRSKSPKTAGATSSSESGKSSGSSSVSAETKSSSSAGSSYSGSVPPLTLIPTTPSKSKSNCNNNTSKSPKHHSSPSKKPSSKNPGTQPKSDYHFTCDSVLPLFLPNPNQLSTEAESGIGKK